MKKVPGGEEDKGHGVEGSYASPIALILACSHCPDIHRGPLICLDTPFYHFRPRSMVDGVETVPHCLDMDDGDLNWRLVLLVSMQTTKKKVAVEHCHSDDSQAYLGNSKTGALQGMQKHVHQASYLSSPATMIVMGAGLPSRDSALSYFSDSPKPKSALFQTSQSLLLSTKL